MIKDIGVELTTTTSPDSPVFFGRIVFLYGEAWGGMGRGAYPRGMVPAWELYDSFEAALRPAPVSWLALRRATDCRGESERGRCSRKRRHAVQ